MPTPPDDDPPDETDLVAYLDGELDPNRTRQIEAGLASDATARADADALRRAFDLLDYLPRTEPSPTFASRTLTKIEPAATGPYSPSGSALMPAPAPRRRRPVLWVAAAILAGGGGYLASAVAPARSERPALLLTDRFVIERLPLYAGVDDLAFVRKLSESDLFAPDDDAPPPAEVAAVPYRDALVALFESFPPARRQQLRDLHEQFEKLDPGERDHLGRVLERYAVWLDALDDTDRRGVLAAPDPGERADEVRRVHARSVRAGLPASVRTRLDQTPDKDEQTRVVMDYRKRESDHRDGWELARRQGESLKAGQKPWPFTDDDLAGRLEGYVKDTLRPRLTGQQSLTLDRLRSAARPELNADGRPLTAGFVYAAYVLAMSDAHPVFPEYGNGSRTICTRDDATAEYKAMFRKTSESRPALSGVPNVWPEIALGVASEAKRAGQTIRPPGPCRPSEFAPAVKAWLAELPAAAQAELKPLQGNWPGYPRRMLDIARRLDTAVPGVPSLPGSPAKWAEYYGPVRGPRK